MTTRRPRRRTLVVLGLAALLVLAVSAATVHARLSTDEPITSSVAQGGVQVFIYNTTGNSGSVGPMQLTSTREQPYVWQGQVPAGDQLKLVARFSAAYRGGIVTLDNGSLVPAQPGSTRTPDGHVVHTVVPADFRAVDGEWTVRLVAPPAGRVVQFTVVATKGNLRSASNPIRIKTYQPAAAAQHAACSLPPGTTNTTVPGPIRFTGGDLAAGGCRLGFTHQANGSFQGAVAPGAQLSFTLDGLPANFQGGRLDVITTGLDGTQHHPQVIIDPDDLAFRVAAPSSGTLQFKVTATAVPKGQLTSASVELVVVP
jgi:hypothetical protein